MHKLQISALLFTAMCFVFCSQGSGGTGDETGGDDVNNDLVDSGTDASTDDAGDARTDETDTVSFACTTIEGSFPRLLDLPSLDDNGVYDPSLARDADNGRLWISYSTVDGPAGSGEVSTHLAFSDDEGLTWCDIGEVNSAEAVPMEDQPESLAQPDAHWSHETSSLTYDPAAEADARWLLVWHRYLHIDDGVPFNEDRRFEHGWIAAKRAASPFDFAEAQEVKLFSSLAYHFNPDIEAYNDNAPGGLPEMRWDTDPELGSCLAFAEPGLVAHDGDLYASLFCARENARDIVLVRYDRELERWSELSTLLGLDDEVEGIETEGFNGAELVLGESGHYLLVSPVRPGGGYLGCVAYPIDLAQGALTDGPRVVAPAPSDDSVFQTGPCTWASDTELGVLTGNTRTSGVQFEIVATGEDLR